MCNILVINAGSSSLKFKFFAYKNNEFNTITSGQFSKTNTDNPTFNININNKKISDTFNEKLAIKDLLHILNKQLKEHFSEYKIDAIGHRVVHGGEIYQEPIIINQDVINNLKKIIYLTPIHMPHNIAPMEVCGDIFVNVQQVACFDTAFHSSISKLHSTYAIPREITEKEKIKRYGFHGLSYEYLINKLDSTHSDIANKKLIIAHLGAGASICALNNKKSIDTTMGLTPLEGLVMGTRCGSIDPAIVLYLMNKGLDYNAISDILYFKSGLLGVSEISSDFINISSSEDHKAKEAYSLFVNSITKNILALSASLKGINAIVFSGGIGENSFKLRNDVLTNLEWLGVVVNNESNKNNNYIITDSNSRITGFVIPTQEELVIAKHTLFLIN